MRQEEALTQVANTIPSTFDFTGEWKNELNSTMEIVQEQSVLTGVYTSQVSGTGKKTSETGQLSGYANGELISFVVKWHPVAITAWVGRHRLEDGESVIETLWQMTSFGTEREDGFWHSINAGADRFTRTFASSVGAGGSAREAAVTVDANTTS